MRLLLDQSLSPRLLNFLADLYPGSQHVRNVGLGAADDEQVCFLVGGPPKVVWIRLGNCSTEDIARLLRQHHADLVAFDQHAEATFMALG